ncbi:gsr4155 [Gloeobacter violaceus PCC 7421]|uniref:Gsr4155 protein n=1 Tax=Gloeobacter violaceus (strain ATCC 29082 / PCC 7421) TaxID=251221 RepID=Q7NDS7_GLOVI|nr:UBP-type zinc finger domain-containing protein [Gloeobacter violaceus]BAC92096.1 gsr4155 [Gloeobacter violaceus PCC 7421]
MLAPRDSQYNFQCQALEKYAVHRLRHYQQSGHPIVRSFEPGEDWRWCYVDRSFV